MKRFLFILLFVSSFAYSATELDISKVKLPEAIDLIYREVFKKPYMLDPELANDERLLSFRITLDIDERAFIKRYFTNMNLRIHERDGIDYIAPYIPKPVEILRETFIYTPKYRSVGYLSDMLSSHVQGNFNNGGVIQSDGQATGTQGATHYINHAGDVLVYYGTKAEIKWLKQILPSIDTVMDEVVVSGYVFEVQTKQSEGSGLALATKILSDKLNLSIGVSSNLDNFISFKSGSVQSIFELLKSDGRFHVVSSPRLRVKNGANAAFSVGSDVPVLGKVSYDKDKPVQSIEYRSSGVIFNIKPNIRQNIIELFINQQLSNFVKTDTGVNDSPTLIKRDIVTEVAVSDGDMIVLGGLAETKNSSASSGFSLFGSKTKENSKTDIVVILQVKKVER